MENPEKMDAEVVIQAIERSIGFQKRQLLWMAETIKGDSALKGTYTELLKKAPEWELPPAQMERIRELVAEMNSLWRTQYIEMLRACADWLEGQS